MQALGEVFHVIHVREMEYGNQIMYCSDEKGGEYTILHFVQEKCVRSLLPLFYALQDNRAFEDYKGCFTNNEELYAVFYKRNGMPLKRLLQEENISLEQRIMLGRQLLEKILLWKLPEFLICQILDPQYILLKGEEIVFDYGWKFFAGDAGNMTMVNKAMAVLFRELFSEEVNNALSPGFMGLLDYLERDKPEDFFEIYEEYNRICNVMPGEIMEHVTILQRWKQKISLWGERILPPVKAVLFIAVYILAVVMLLEEMHKKDKEKEEIQGVVFESIGTLPVQKAED